MKPNRPKAWPEAFLPWVVAESVCDEAGRYLGVNIPRQRARWLTEKAEICFQRNPRFRKQIRAAGNTGMSYLRMYMRHWLASMLHVERPDLTQRLPYEYAWGKALPPGQAPRVPRHRRLYRHRDWKASRVWQSPCWSFLAGGSGDPDREFPIR